MIKNFSRYRYLLFLIALALNGCFKQAARSPEPENIVIYPSPPAKVRIQYLTSFSSSLEFAGPRSAFKQFVFGEEAPLPIVKPYGVAVHGNKLYICDTGIGGLEILDLKQKTFTYFIPKGRGQLLFPINCHVDEGGNLYIADGNRKQLVIFDKEGNYIHAVGMENDGKPTDVIVDKSRIWVSVVDDHSIQYFDKTTFEYLGKIQENNARSDGYLYQPANMTLADSLLYISDLGACQISSFTLEGDYKNSFGKPGEGFGEFTRPKGICADREGNIYIVDAAFENIQIFNPAGQLLMSFGGTYQAPGGMWLPADVTIDYSNLDFFRPYLDPAFQLKYLIYVTNQYGPDKISVYGFIEEEK